ncbi:hypothetical protein [Alloalcanivorax profundimaris]|uniref:hypothetical protein n=1 Tax=Alloalcanivorax profundimaris TaxID=2735259 RepID=UPI0018878045|nr:hypothetical protein [Alloalcanivorax profundimaris]MBF1802572.1 hypothetical protein [Alloalcanivorax profundimaris]MCQ6263558.1 hypothetical protein [Alcanivorax sp. MM125-6]
MSIEIMKKGALSLIGAAAIVASGNVLADGEIYDGAQSPTGPLTSATRSFTDSSATLTANVFGNPTDITCALTLDGQVDIDASGTSGTVTVSSGDVSGGFLCGLVELQFASNGGQDWVATADEADLASISNPVGDVPLTFQNVSVNLCNNGNPVSVDTVFNNNGNGTLLSGDSTFTFDNAAVGGCSFTATLTPDGDDIDVVANP